VQPSGAAPPEGVELLLVSRREHAVYNSVGQQLPALRRRRPFNPAYLNPADAERIGVEDGDTILIESTCGAVRAVLQSAPDVREGVVSLAHGFESSDGEGQGACTARLVDDANDYDAISGQPRMSAIPVRVRRAARVSRA
jgi:anaerobic selenocysteine-containing dehydrogenase